MLLADPGLVRIINRAASRCYNCTQARLSYLSFPRGRNEDLALYADHSLDRMKNQTTPQGRSLQFVKYRDAGEVDTSCARGDIEHILKGSHTHSCRTVLRYSFLTTDREPFALASSFNEYVKPELSYTASAQQESKKGDHSGLRPGADYNNRGDVLTLLQFHGWTIASRRGHILDLRRPGKKDGHSATLHAVGHNCFYSFSHEC